MSLGLRERKKLKTRTSIQKQAMRLFLKKGYAATTIDEIAEAVEISPSTFFNYFPNKEAVVLQDDLDPPILAAFDSQPADLSPVAALRNAMRIVLADLSPEQDAFFRQRVRLMSSEPELRATMLNQFADLVEQIAQLMANRVGRSADDFALHNLAGALLGVMMSAMLVAADQPEADMVTLADQALAHLEAGLPLDWPPKT
jgi:AcrR family transcriptional regulator